MILQLTRLMNLIFFHITCQVPICNKYICLFIECVKYLLNLLIFVTDMLYNEVTMTNEEEIIELSCITNNELQYEDLDIAWLKYDPPILHKINCKM